MLETVSWHHVRYAAPFVATALAAGVLGFAALSRRLWTKPRGKLVFACFWLIAFGGTFAARRHLDATLARAPVEIDRTEAKEIWRWIDRVKPSDGVVAVYQTTAPLSSRRLLFSYVLDGNRPKGYPRMIGEEIRWVFLKNGDLDPQVLIGQGFKIVHNGKFLTIFRRDPHKSVGSPKISPNGANVLNARAVESREPLKS